MESKVNSSHANLNKESHQFLTDYFVEDMDDLEPFSLEMLEARSIIPYSKNANGQSIKQQPGKKPLDAQSTPINPSPDPEEPEKQDQSNEVSGDALRPEQAEALLTISALLNSDLNPGRVLGDMLKSIRSLFHANRAAVFLRQNIPLNDTASQIVQPQKGKTEVGPIICAAALNLSSTFINQVIHFYESKEFLRLQELQHPDYIADAQHDLHLNGVRDLNKREGVLTILTLPLMHRQLLIGLLVLYNDNKRVYSPQEIKLLNVFANQAALSISNARLYNEARRREREAAILAQASRAFNSSLRLKEVLNHVVQTSTSVLGNTALIFILREGSDKAYPIAYYSKVGLAEDASSIKRASPVRTQPPIRLGEGAIGKTIQSGVPFFIRNTKDIQKAAPFILEQDNVQSLLCLPLKMHGKAIGALITYNINIPVVEEAVTKKSRDINERQIVLAQGLAERAAVAIENARLYEAEKREQQLRDEFLSFVAHELRTPLTSIKGYNHLLARKLKSPIHQFQAEPLEYLRSLTHYTDVMDNQSERLQNLIQDLSSIGRIQKGQLELNLHKVNLVELVRDTVSLFEAELNDSQQTPQKREINFRFTRPVIEAQIDSEATSRIIRSLLSNAVKFSSKEGDIAVRVSQTGNEASIDVQDWGVGLSPTDQEHIFERFYKASSPQGRANGLGLGLYIARSLAEAQQGRLTVKSEEGEGSIFTLTFPAKSPLKKVNPLPH